MEAIFTILFLLLCLFISWKILKRLYRLVSAGSRMAYDHREDIASGVSATGRTAGKVAMFLGKAAANGARATAKMTEEALRERRRQEIVNLNNLVQQLIYTMSQVVEPSLQNSKQALMSEVVVLERGLATQNQNTNSEHFIVNHISTGKEMERLHKSATHIQSELNRLLAQQEQMRGGSSQSGQRHYREREETRDDSASMNGAERELYEAYKTLEIDPEASDDEIKKQYRRLLKIWHSDKAGNDADLLDLMTKKTQEINNAYDIVKKVRGLK